MTHDPAAYSHALLTAAVALADILARSRDSGASVNVSAIISAATPHLAPGWVPSLEDQAATYALAIGLCHSSSRASLLHLRAALG